MSVKIALLPEQLENIKKNKITIVKKFSKIEQIFDFNLLISFIEKCDLPVVIQNKNNLFENSFQIKKVEAMFSDFKFFQNYLKQVASYPDHEKNGCDIFFSFKSCSGFTHVDPEDVFIIGLHGKTLYKTFGESIEFHEINKGDLIFIPNGIPHKVISLSPRIILSVGFFRK